MARHATWPIFFGVKVFLSSVPFRFPGRAEAATPQGGGRGESRPTREDGTSVGRGDRAGGVQKRPDCRGTVAKPARGRGVPKRGRYESEDASALEGRGTKGGGAPPDCAIARARDEPASGHRGRGLARGEGHRRGTGARPGGSRVARAGEYGTRF